MEAVGKKVWVTGAGGLIGSYLIQTAPRGIQACGLNRNQLDLTDLGAMKALFHQEQPEAIIHCAALSKTPACQADPNLARRINVEGTARLAELAASLPFIFFSTDLVFDGNKGNYTETDAVNPLSVYAQTKAEAEQAVLRNSGHTVIRTSLNGGISPTGDRGFNEELRRAGMAGKQLKLFIDEFRCPIAAKVTSQAIWELLERRANGIYHIAGTETLSRYQIGQLLAARWPDISLKIERGSLRDYQGPPRSPDTSLNCAKAQTILSFKLPRFSEWLTTHPHEPF